jgi:nucleoside-diphosphate-sugar epimerase
MKILLTGATGFIGQCVLKMLCQDGHQVNVLGRRPPSSVSSYPSLPFFLYDGSYESALAACLTSTPDVVIHLATYFVGTHQPDDLNHLVDANIRLGLHLLEAMKTCGCRAWLNASSAWQYTAGTPFSPNGLYAASKSALDALVTAYVQEAGLQAQHLIIYESYGPEDTRPKLIPSLLKQAQDGTRHFSLVGKDKHFYFVHVEDIARAFLMASRALFHLTPDTPATFAHYALHPPEAPASIEDVVNTMAKAWQLPLSADYGVYPFRPNEVLMPPTGLLVLPEWSPRLSLEEGLTTLWHPLPTP